jgi:predicted dehydrogenase
MTDPDVKADAIPSRLIVAGCGPHFRQIYLQVLAQHRGSVRVVLVVDLQSQEQAVRAAMAAAGAKPDMFLFLPDEWRGAIPQAELAKRLDCAILGYEADAVLICTEPRAHRAFAEWAMGRRLDIFMDKPISAFSNMAGQSDLSADFSALRTMQRRAGSRFVVSCERRQHFGYRYIFDFLRDFMKRDGCSITSVNVHFGAGKSLTEDEYLAIENHPFKYGFGVLLHSGYHYIDLIARLAALNGNGESEPCEPEVASFFRRQVSRPSTASHPSCLAGIAGDRGEVDVVAAGFYPGHRDARLTFGLQLLGNTVSARHAHSPLGASPPPGRLRQEYVAIHLGNACSITVHSDGFDKLDDYIDDRGFRVTIALGEASIDGAKVLTVDQTRLSSMIPECPREGSLNQHARASMFRKFLVGEDCDSSLESHHNTVVLLQKIYDNAR